VYRAGGAAKLDCTRTRGDGTVSACAGRFRWSGGR